MNSKGALAQWQIHAARRRPSPGDSYVQSFARGLEVIRSFSARAPRQTLTEVAAAHRPHPRRRAPHPAHAADAGLRGKRRQAVRADAAHPRPGLRLPLVDADLEPGRAGDGSAGGARCRSRARPPCWTAPTSSTCCACPRARSCASAWAWARACRPTAPRWAGMLLAGLPDDEVLRAPALPRKLDAVHEAHRDRHRRAARQGAAGAAPGLVPGEPGTGGRPDLDRRADRRPQRRARWPRSTSAARPTAPAPR